VAYDLAMRGWTALVLTLGTCASVYLVLGRGAAAAIWVLTPLMLWLVTATRVSVGLIASGIQTAAITFIALGAGGHLPTLAWAPSIWDAVTAYALIALISCIAAVRDQGEHLRWYSYSRPTRARRTLAKITRVTLPTALLVLCCLGVVLVLPVHPVRPPNHLVYPLPSGVSVTYERTLCGPGPAVVCTWKMDVDSREPSVYVLRDQLADHLTYSRGWPSNLPDKQCRTWGWIVKEHACLTVELRDLVLLGPSIAGILSVISAANHRHRVLVACHDLSLRNPVS